MTAADDALQTFRRVAADWHPSALDTDDVIAAGPARRFSAILDVDSPVTGAGDVLPPLWHRFFFLPVHPHASLGPDGHPRTTPLTPPIGAHRRLFGGCRISFQRPLRCDDHVHRRSEVIGVRAPTGRGGPLLIVTIRHTCSIDDEPYISEEHDILYRAPLAAKAPPELVSASSDRPMVEDRWTLSWLPDPVLLFRYSALSQNAHRIHYDEPYSREVEGHPGLVVQGLLLALLMLELPRRFAPDRRIDSLTWRADSSLYAGQRLYAYGRPAAAGAELSIGNGATPEAITGTVTFAS